MKHTADDQQQRELTWPTADDKKWAAEFELTLAWGHSAPKGLAEQVLAEAHETAVESGAPVRELLGDPIEYAATVAAERVGETHRSTVDLHGFTPGGRFTGALLVAGFKAVLFGIVLWLSKGFWISVGWPSGIASVLLGVVVVLVLGVVPELRAAGRLRASWVAIGCAPVLVLACATGFTVLPPGPQVSVPAPSLFAVGAVLWVVGWRLPERTAGRWFAGRRATAVIPRTDDEAWLARLAGLLRGRHGLSPRAVRQCLAEARDHLQASGGSAAEEFGAPEIYALRLAEGPDRPKRAARALIGGQVLVGVMYCWFVYDILSSPDPTSVWFWVRVAVALLGIWGWSSLLWTYWKGTRQQRKPEPQQA
ncbi:hypothetical protein [Streptomyces apocyni]|uniref:hypothetical protein n=1 Tax=Streptomyces apocyni TaxID=2654677 RepID=UPI0012EA4FD3|nr:hypothetical protein [Streptomyces apocyni]